ncbi:MAG: YitT family protein [Erysipelotrichaceae bacterium]|nr:YitT family protein [Erysipelotrichaceae bacterium]
MSSVKVNGIDIQSTKEKIMDFSLVLLGSFLLAVASAYFIVPHDVLTGGCAGIAVIVTKVTGISTELLINGLTISLFLIGCVFLGRDFAIKTVTSSIAYPIFNTLLSQTNVYIDVDPVVASIYTGVLLGAGVGIVFRTGASTGGTDIPPLIIHKFTHIPLHTLVLLVDALTVGAGFIVFGIEKVLVGLISVYISAVVIDKTMLMGGQQSKAIYIISEHYEKIMEEIHNKLERGSTILTATGGYTKQERPVIYVVISQKQYPELNRLLAHLDPQAFVVVSDATEVHGLGFTYDD